MKVVIFSLFSSLLWFTVAAEVPQCPTVTGLTLIDAEDNTASYTLPLGALKWDADKGLITADILQAGYGEPLLGINYGSVSVGCDLNFRVNTNDACEDIESVFIELVKLDSDGGEEVGTAYSRCENDAPYAMGGDVNGDYFALSPPPSLGYYAVYITTHSGNGCNEASIIETYRVPLSVQQRFTFFQDYFSFQGTTAISMNNFYRWNAETNVRVAGGSVPCNSFYNKEGCASQEFCLGSFNIEAEVPNACGVEKVVFELFSDGDKILDRTEVEPPYMLCGDSPGDGNIFACEDLPEDVFYELTATVFWKDGFTGPVDSLSTGFTVKCGPY